MKQELRYPKLLILQKVSSYHFLILFTSRCIYKLSGSKHRHADVSSCGQRWNAWRSLKSSSLFTTRVCSCLQYLNSRLSDVLYSQRKAWNHTLFSEPAINAIGTRFCWKFPGFKGCVSKGTSSPPEKLPKSPLCFRRNSDCNKVADSKSARRNASVETYSGNDESEEAPCPDLFYYQKLTEATRPFVSLQWQSSQTGKHNCL